MTDQTPDPMAEFRREVVDKLDVARHRGEAKAIDQIVVKQCEDFIVEQAQELVDRALAAERAQHQQEIAQKNTRIGKLEKDIIEGGRERDDLRDEIERMERRIADAIAERDAFRWNADLATRRENERLKSELEQRDETIRQLQDAFARCQEVQQATAETWCIEHDQMAEQIRLLRGAMAADDERLRRAAEQAGILYVSCDTAEALAEQITRLSAQVAELEAERAAEREAELADPVAQRADRYAAEASDLTLRLIAAEAERDAAQQQIATLTQELSVSRANHIDANQRNMQSVRELEAAEARCAALTEAIEKALGFHQVTHTHAILSAALQSTRPQATETKPGIFVAAESTSVFKSTRTQEQP